MKRPSIFLAAFFAVTSGVTLLFADIQSPSVDNTNAPSLTITSSSDGCLNVDSGVLYVDCANDIVGFGTPNPEDIVHLQESASAAVGPILVLDNNASSTVGNESQIAFLTDSGASVAGVSNARFRVINDNAGNGAVTVQIDTYDGGSEDTAFFIDTARDIGMGTVTPGYNLEVQENDSNETATIVARNLGAGDSTLGFQTASANNYAIGIDNSDSDKFKIGRDVDNVATNTVFTITTDGDTGIGDDAAPNTTLQVSTNGAVSKFASVQLQDDETHDLGNFGDNGTYIIHSSQGNGCMFMIAGDAATLLTSENTTCAVADTDGKLALIAAGSGVYNLKNRLGATYKFAIHFVGFE